MKRTKDTSTARSFSKCSLLLPILTVLYSSTVLYAADGDSTVRTSRLPEAVMPNEDKSEVKSLKGSDPQEPSRRESVVPPLPPSDNPQPAAPAQGHIDRKLWIQNVLLKIDRMRNDAVAQIKKADASILAGQSLLSQAQAQKNTKVETTVRQTIAQAREVKRKNELNKARAEEAIARVQNLLAKMSGENIPVQAVINRVTGTALMKDRNEKFLPLNENRTHLEPGDTVQTLENSRAEFQMLEGGGSVTMGPNTKIKVTSDGTEPITHEMLELFNGTVHMIRVKGNSRRFGLRTRTAVCAVRGTELLVNVDSDLATEIVLLEGKLDVQSLNGDKTVSLEAGHMLRVPLTGVVPEPVAFDSNSVNRWWEDE